MYVEAWGTDGVNNWSVNGRGESWCKGWMWSAGLLTLEATFEDLEAPCEWPLSKNNSAELTLLAVGVDIIKVYNVSPSSVSWVKGFAGDLQGTGWCSTGGVNVHCMGGGITADLTNVIRIGPSPVGQ